MILAFDEMNVLAVQSTTFEELNSIAANRKQKHMDIDRYFDEMDLSGGDKKARKSYARKMDRILFTILAYLYLVIRSGVYTDTTDVKNRLRDELVKLANEFTSPDSHMLSYIERYSSWFVDATAQRALTYRRGDAEKLAYWFSADRATYNAENEANAIFNYDEYRIAKADGCTLKTWKTMRDERVRKSHAEVHNVTVGVDEYFIVGDSLMLFPKDPNAPPEEVVNCRCLAIYH